MFHVYAYSLDGNFLENYFFKNPHKRECNTILDSTGNMLKKWEPEETG